MSSLFDAMYSSYATPLMEHAGEPTPVLYSDGVIADASPMCIVQDRHIYDEPASDQTGVALQVETCVVIIPREAAYSGVDKPLLNATITIGGVKFSVDRNQEQAIQAVSSTFTRVACRRVVPTGMYNAPRDRS